MAFSAGPPGGTRRIGTSLAEINIIPLVDVVLVLLLIFMLTAPMMYRGIDVNLPRAAAKPTAVEERMVLTVTKDRALYLNEKRVPPGGLEGMLRDAFRTRKDKTVYLKAGARPCPREGAAAHHGNGPLGDATRRPRRRLRARAVRVVAVAAQDVHRQS